MCCEKLFSLTWLEWSVDQAERSLRVEQVIALTDVCNTLLKIAIDLTKQRNFC